MQAEKGISTIFFRSFLWGVITHPWDESMNVWLQPIAHVQS